MTPRCRHVDDIPSAHRCEPPDYVCALEWEHSSTAGTFLSRRIRNRDTIQGCVVHKPQPVPFWDTIPVKILRRCALRSSDGARFLTFGSCSCLRGESCVCVHHRGRSARQQSKATVRSVRLTTHLSATHSPTSASWFYGPTTRLRILQRRFSELRLRPNAAFAKPSGIWADSAIGRAQLRPSSSRKFSNDAVCGT